MFLQNPKPKQNSHKEALTLVEIMIVAVLFAVGILSLFVALGGSLDLYNATQVQFIGSRAAEAVLEELRGYKKFDTLYQDFSVYNGNGTLYDTGDNPINDSPQNFFYIMADGSIDWSRPTTRPAGAVGFGWFDFVVQENRYDEAVWGTETAFNPSSPGTIDLNGDGDTNDTVLVGRTSGSPISGNYYHFLPVVVHIRILPREGQWDLSQLTPMEQTLWLTNNGEQ